MESNISLRNTGELPNGHDANANSQTLLPLVYKDNHWRNSEISMLVIGVVLIVGFFICYFLSIHWDSLFYSETKTPAYSQAEFYSELKILVIVGSLGVAIGAILILIAVIKMHNRSEKYYSVADRAGKIRTV